MAPNPALLKALDLPSVAEDEDISTALTGLITSAVHDEVPKQTLSEIYKDVVSYSGKDYLDALHLVPLLLPSTEIAAHDILALIGECGSPREVIITAQEAIEGLRHAFENEDDDNEETQSAIATKPQASLSTQLTALLDLYASAIQRIKLRRKPASETIQPFIQETEATIKVAAPQCNRDESISLITSVSHLSNKIALWCSEVTTNQDTELSACKVMVKTLLDRTLIALSESLRSMIAQRTLEEYFPRQTIPSSGLYNWKQGEITVMEVLSSYELLGFVPTKTGPFSTRDLFFFAYKSQEDHHDVLPHLMPVILSALKTNTFVDESLAVLLKVFHAYQAQHGKHVLPPDFSASLCSVLPSIASAHPDPLIRNQVFRCLSLVLSASDPHSRFQQLKELCDDPQYPQMRVASVGLVKEALLRAISDPSKEDKYFMRPLFLPSFGAILFRTNPPDLLSSDLSLQDFQESPESARLVECLSLYYILIHRDVQNLTGIRDPDVRQTLDRNLLSPLRSAIDRWAGSTSQESQGHAHDISPIVSLQISIERIEKAHYDLY